MQGKTSHGSLRRRAILSHVTDHYAPTIIWATKEASENFGVEF
jgi:hypothetical protein